MNGAWNLAASWTGDDDSDDEGELSTDVDTSTSYSMLYNDFLNFLRLACGGSPLEGYPAVIVILSTLPPQVSEISNLTSLCLPQT